MIGKLRANLYRTVGAITRKAGTIAAALPWGLGQPGPHTSASKSIRRHILAGVVLISVLDSRVGRLASTAQISGALIAQGSMVVNSNVKKVQHPTAASSANYLRAMATTSKLAMSSFASTKL